MSAVLKPRTADECAVAPSVPHYKSFQIVVDPRVRRAKDYEQALLFALDMCPPEFADRLNKEIEWARAEQNRDTDADREAVYRAVKFPLTRAEIAEDTGLSPSTVWKRLQELVDAGRVVESKRPVQGNNKFVLIYTRNPILP